MRHLCVAAAVLLCGATPAHFKLDALAEHCGGVCAYEREGTAATLRTEPWQVRCRLDSARYQLNDVVVYGQHPVTGVANHLCISSYDWNRVLVPLLSPPEVGKIGRICIDPGHGGHDSGAHRDGLVEKTLALDIALRLRALLERRGLEVVLTRSDDRFIPLDQRPAMGNGAGCDLFLSIHLNAADSPRAEGIETYVLPPAGMPPTAQLGKPPRAWGGNQPNAAHNERNLWFGYCLQRRLHQLPHCQDRGVRRSNFRVLAASRCPAALVECAFLSNAGEAGRLRTDAYRDALARALCEGILDYASGGGGHGEFSL
jgi:N-acetylmuramoyl-L-alanine amidase